VSGYNIFFCISVVRAIEPKPNWINVGLRDYTDWLCGLPVTTTAGPQPQTAAPLRVPNL